MITTIPADAPYAVLTHRPLATFRSGGYVATFSARSDGWVSYVVGRHPHWCEAGARRTPAEAVAAVKDAVEYAVRARRLIQSPAGDPARTDAET